MAANTLTESVLKNSSHKDFGRLVLLIAHAKFGQHNRRERYDRAICRVAGRDHALRGNLSLQLRRNQREQVSFNLINRSAGKGFAPLLRPDYMLQNQPRAVLSGKLGGKRRYSVAGFMQAIGVQRPVTQAGVRWITLQPLWARLAANDSQSSNQ